MSLHEFCRRDVVRVSSESNIVEACRLMGENDVGCVVVEEAGKLCGILTDRDIALKVTGKSKDPKKTKVQEIMTRNPIRISVDESFRELTSLMHTHHIRRVPVVDGIDKVLGIVSMDDFIGLISDEMSDLHKTVARILPATSS